MMENDSTQAVDSGNFTPWEHQVELLEKAINHNSIVLLGTGSGKTFIAAMLIKELADDIRIPFEEGGKRSFFLVGTVPLVLQQAESIKKHTGLNVGVYYGEKGCDMWTFEHWIEELRANQVFVMTAQICSMFFDHGFFHISQANVIIFDECHKTDGSHPYSRIMTRYEESLKQQQKKLEAGLIKAITLPRILGLTPSLINKNARTQHGLQNAIQKLTRKLDAKIITASDLKTVHRTKPEKSLHSCSPWMTDSHKERFKLLIKILSEDARMLDHISDDPDQKMIAEKIKDTLKRAWDVFQQLGPWCCMQIMDKLNGKLQNECDALSDPMEKATIIYGQTQLRMVKRILTDVMGDSVDNLKAVMKYWVPQRLQQVLIILEQFPQRVNDEFSGVIFVEQRYIAKALKEMMEIIIQRFNYTALSYLKLEYVVGSSSPNMTDQEVLGMSPIIRLRQVMKDFRQKRFNLLLATNVLEEGVDVPHCNCVIHFDAPRNFTSYIQAQGRARKSNSVYHVLAEEDIKWKLKDYADIEQLIYNRSFHGKPPRAREPFDSHEADIYHPPYFPPVPETVQIYGTPKADMLNAIGIVNRYCANLPSDVFTRLVTKYHVRKLQSPIGNDQSLYQGYLILPLNSPVKEIIYGKPMPSRRYARGSCAMEVCKKLYEMGELSHHLLPIRAEAMMTYLLDEPNVETDERSILETDGKCGTKRRRHFYPRKIAWSNDKDHSNPAHPMHMHLLDIQSTSLDSQKTPFMLGVLSPKPFPKMPTFPVYSGSGTHEYNVQVISIDTTDHEKSMDLISEFHQLIFEDVLKLKGNSLQYEPDVAGNTLFIVPLVKGQTLADEYECEIPAKRRRIDDDQSKYKIDLDIIRNTLDKMIKQQQRPTDDERKAMKFDAKKYHDAVIAPWYRRFEDDGPEFCYVKTVHYDKSPKDILYNATTATYLSSFMERRQIEIYDHDQPLLECIPRGFKAIMPNYSALRQRNSEPPEEAGAIENGTKNGQLFVPELVHVHPIPASIWKRLNVLPFILHRINTIMLALEWNQKVESEAFDRTEIDYDMTAITLGMDIMASEYPQSQLDQADQADDQSDQDDDDDEVTQFQPIEQDMWLPNAIPDDSSLDSVTSDSDDESTPQSKVLTDDVFRQSTPIPAPNLITHLDLDHMDQSNGPHPGTLVAALTMLNADDGSNLERLETIGDSFLKLSVSEYLYNAFEEFHEGKLSFLKSELISNRTLFRLGLNRQLTDYMTANRFDPFNNWMPPGYRLIEDEHSELGQRRYHYQLISDKSLADCVEATVGVYVLTYGRTAAAKYLKWLGIGVKPKKGDETIDLWSKKARDPLLHYIQDPMNDLRLLWAKCGFKELEQILGYEFKNKAYLVQALTHPTYSKNRCTDCYQPLEFIGDAVLDYLITNHLFNDQRRFRPGLLTDLRQALVNNTLFAALAVKHKFHIYMLSACPQLLGLIDEFVQIQESMQFEVNFNQLLCLMEENECDAAEVEVPKALGDIFESVAGAVYLDSGSKLDVVWSVYYPIIEKQIEICCADPPMAPIRELLELFPNQVHYEKMERTIPGQTRVAVRIAGKDKVFIGQGRKVRAAKNTAAKKALKFYRSD